MILKGIRELKENDILARDILTEDYRIILPQGAAIRADYIEKLEELEIKEVYVREEEEFGKIVILKTEIEKSIKETVKDILERHTYQKNEELLELNKAADEIIESILEEDKVVEKVFDIKERSSDIYEHSISICTLAMLTALKLNVEISKIHDIGVGCLLHEIGLRYTTLNYSDKDILTLNRQEVIEYKKHPVYGYSSLKDEGWISDLSKSIILYHHERIDGSGFPLRTKDISYECRIVNVCDAFDEMICGIGCKRVRIHEAIEYLKNYKGRLFDEKIVDTFLGFTAVYPAGTKVITNEGEVGIVLSQNKHFQDRPIIRIIRDKVGNEVKEEVIKDLVKVHHVFIEKITD